MERIVVNRSATLTHGFSFTPTGTPSVSVVRSDGTAVTVGSVTGSATDWTYTIPASSNTLLDTLTETWTAVSGGQSQQFVDQIEVAGGNYFAIAEFRALSAKFANTTDYPDKDIAEIRSTVEQAIEDAFGVAFVPRFTRETFNAGLGGSLGLTLRWPHIRSVRSLVVDGAAMVGADAGFLDAGIVIPPAAIAPYSTVVVGYEHGFDQVSLRIKRGALQLAKRWAVAGATDERAISVTNDTGTYALFQAGVGGHVFDLPELQAAYQVYGRQALVA